MIPNKKRIDKTPMHQPKLEPTAELTQELATEPTPEVAIEPTKHKKSKLKLQQEKIWWNIWWNIWNHFKHESQSFSAKELIRATQDKNEKSISNVNDGLIN